MPENTSPTVTPIPNTPDPSTYRQVLKNMQQIATMLGDLDSFGGSLGEAFKQIKENFDAINKTITKLDETVTKVENIVVTPPAGGGIVNTEDGIKVIGVHVNTNTSNENTLIADYSQGVTWEFKSVSVIGLSGKPGMSGEYCAVMTVKKDDPIEGETEEINASEFQMAYGTEGLYFYRRDPNPDGSWGDWISMDLGDDFRYQIVESATAPTDQKPGEYWAEPIEYLDKEMNHYGL